jgi:hypothetical protein
MKFKLEDLTDLLVEGEWEYKVIEAKETASKKDGKPQFELLCKVADKNGKTADVKTWIPLWKLEEFCRSGGLDNEFDNLEVTPRDCLKAEGKCIGKIQKGEITDNGKYPDKNIIATFISCNQKEFKDDDINF